MLCNLERKIINQYIIAAQKNKDCVCFLYKQEPENRKSVAFVYTGEHGSKKLKCSCVQILWVAHRGAVEENPGPFTQTNNGKNAPMCQTGQFSFIIGIQVS